MNSKNYTISQNEWLMTTVYDHGAIAKTILEKDSGVISFCLRDESVYRIDITKHFFPDSIFLHQFGISVTEDGNVFFVQHWESGLYCFELPSGKLRWKSKLRHPYEIVVHKDTVICRFLDQCVDAISIRTGEIVAHYPLGYDKNFLPLSDTYYLVGPKRSRYHIIDNNLSICATIPGKLLNPSDFDNFIMLEANMHPKGILISGFESSSELEQQCCFEGRFGTDQFRYSRVVEIDLGAIEMA